MSVKTARTSKELVEAARTCLADGAVAPGKAGDLLTSAVQQDPTFVNALVLRSNLASRIGQLAAATADLSLAIEVDRGSSDVRRVASLYGSRSALLARAGRHADAIADLRAALKCEPDNGIWAYELGRAYLRDGRVALAQLNFQLALQEPMWSHVSESMRPKIYALYGRSCLMSRDYKKAKALLAKSLEVGGEGAAVLHDVGLAHYHEGSAPSSAIDFFARATEMDAQAVDYPMRLGLAHTRCGNFSDALSSMNEAVLRGQDAPLLRFYRGCIELQLGLGPQALVDLQGAAEQHLRMSAAAGCGAAARRAEDGFARSMASTAPVFVAMALVHLFCENSVEAACACLTDALGNDLDEPQRTLAAMLLGIVLHCRGEVFPALRVLLSIACAPKTPTGDAAGCGAAAASPLCASSPGENAFCADVELLALTHVGLAYSACGYADLALRFFTQARRRAEQSGDEALIAACRYREATALVELRDDFGALAAIRAPIVRSLLTEYPAAVNSVGVLSGSTTFSMPAESPAAAAASAATPCCSHLILHRQCPGETAHLAAVTLRRLGRLPEALESATAAVAELRAAAESSGGGGTAAAPLLVVGGVPPAYLYNRALLHFLLRQYDEAMSDVQASIEASSAAADAAAPAEPFYLRGCIAHATGHFADALASLATALEMDGSLRQSPAFSFSHGVLLAIAGQNEDAVTAFSAAITHSSLAASSSSSVRNAAAAARCPAVYFHERAKVCQRMGRYDAALADYNCVLPPTGSIATSSSSSSSATAPVNWNALVNRALTLKELQRYDEAAVDWDAALRLDTSGCLADFTSQDIFDTPYLDLCLPGCELYPSCEAAGVAE